MGFAAQTHLPCNISYSAGVVLVLGWEHQEVEDLIVGV